MKWKGKILMFFIFLMFSPSLFSRTIKIGIYRANAIQSIDFVFVDTEYILETNTGFKSGILAGQRVSMRREGAKVVLTKNNQLLGTFSQIQLIPTNLDATIRLQPKNPVLKTREYKDAFQISSGSKGLTIVNEASYHHYLAGVIQSEGGNNRALEYYKAQAVISRTYALRHLERHKKEGFNLCDQVHCQVYHNQLVGAKDIERAVTATEGVYMVYEPTNELVEAYFHANCGGQTIGADYVWKENIPYLKSIKDTFCIKSSHSQWTVKIEENKWQDFLVKKYFYPIEDSIYRYFISDFQQEERKALYLSPHLGIPLRDIRYQFRLKSTFFSTKKEENKVVVTGKGFGHGVGLCQEGAMKMASLGYNYQQILSFYYTNVTFKKYYEEIFFNQNTDNNIDL